MPGQLPEGVKKERSRVLIEIGTKHQREFMEKFLGQKRKVLFEEQQEIQGITYWVGHTMEYLKVGVLSQEELGNQILEVKLTEILPEGIIVGEKE